ncbi:MAG: hypothetical protein LAO31_21450 [Acidobacteriia bacterium]|nr:hypothetical protein [Terriglobia bacterium]
MMEISKSQDIKLKGEIAEIFDKNGQRLVKVSLNPCLIELTLHGSPEMQLGDTVVLSANMVIEGIEILFSNPSPSFKS